MVIVARMGRLQEEYPDEQFLWFAFSNEIDRDGSKKQRGQTKIQSICWYVVFSTVLDRHR
jgi:hypothetical protein